LLVALNDQTPVRPQTVIYLNRLGDVLFVMARFQNKSRGEPDTLWKNPP
jgi:cob(I)alamin adenosyltransferase